jgi:hypothetical protein
VDGSGQPAGDIAVWDEVLFPSDSGPGRTRELFELTPPRRGAPSRRRPGQRSRSTTPAMGMAPPRVTIHNLTSNSHAPVHRRACAKATCGHRSGGGAEARGSGGRRSARRASSTLGGRGETRAIARCVDRPRRSALHR